MRNLAVYVHVPFCKARCSYCSFVSSTGSDEDVEVYFDALIKEINAFDFSSYVVSSVYFGGGTPSRVSPLLIEKTLSAIKNECAFNADAEITLECNPESFSAGSAFIYAEAGVNRISFGLQTLNDGILKRIGRIHDGQTFYEAFSAAEKLFGNISVDLMIGLPGQTKEILLQDIEELAALDGLKHVSTYGLKVEEGTRMYSEGYRPDEDYSAEMYESAVLLLEKNGFSRYEVSNFAKGEEFVCRHNRTYWTRGEYAGFGAAAHSFVNDTRIENTPVIAEYVKGKYRAAEHYVDPAGSEAADETLMLSLRTAEGLDLAEYKEKFGRDLLEEKKSELAFLKDFVQVKKGRLALKDPGWYVMNEIITRLL